MRCVLPSLLLCVMLLSACGGASPTPTIQPPPQGGQPAPSSCDALGPMLSRVGFRPDKTLSAGVVNAEEWNGGRGGPLAYVAPPQGWRLPEGVTFSVEPTPAMEAGGITVRAALVNGSSSEADVYLWNAAMGEFGVTLSGADVALTERPREGPREVYPSTTHYRLPPGGRIDFRTTVVLDCYEYPEGATGELTWHLNLHGANMSGELQATLP